MHLHARRAQPQTAGIQMAETQHHVQAAKEEFTALKVAHAGEGRDERIDELGEMLAQRHEARKRLEGQLGEATLNMSWGASTGLISPEEALYRLNHTSALAQVPLETASDADDWWHSGSQHGSPHGNGPLKTSSTALSKSFKRRMKSFDVKSKRMYHPSGV